ncbi:acyl-CoA dehydrogenase family protein [Mycobacterium gallinarum]|nr:acyl-CoA dehydrogenase family protein [Mycobacterium gallinarum]
MSDDWRVRLTRLLAEFVPDRSADRIKAARAWHSRLVDEGLAAPGWPKTVGGLELALEDQLDYYRMTTAAGAPTHPCPLSFIVAPTLIAHGTQEQKDRFLRPLLRADEFWCQGFSEPEAGSDLASLSTSAIRDGDVYRVTGQKVWTTMAERADWMFTLVRTGPAGRSTDGITYLLIPMNSKGIEIRPLRDISGATHFAEVFLDDVQVDITNRVGAEGEGWSIMRTSLGHERATAFLADEFKYRKTADKVISLVVAQGLGDDSLVRQDVARLESGVRTIAANSARALAAVLRGEDPGAVASVNRLVKSEFEQHMHAFALRVSGAHGALGSRAPEAVDNGRWTYGYLMSRATTIGAGTAEIQRNTIAESVLGLPSHRGDGTRVPAVVPGAPLAVPESDEQQLRDVLAKALRRDLHEILDKERPFDATDGAMWASLLDFGLPGLAVDEALGGTGAPRRMLYAALEEVGKAVAAVPLVPTVTALEVAVAVGAKAVAERITAGASAAFVVPLDDSGWQTAGSGLPGWCDDRLSGAVSVVPGAPVAEVLLVLAADGVLIAVDRDAEGVDVVAQQPLDLSATVGAVTLSDVAGEVIADGARLRRGLDQARRYALLAGASDSIGVGARALAMTVEWACRREQFGRPIGSYQAVSHRCADMLVALENARSQVSMAAEADEVDADCAAELAAAAGFDAAVSATEAALQLHGGIGFTWEHPIHLLLRRARANAVLMGRAEALRERAARRILAAAN